MTNKIHDIIIIGGGISGSYLAFKLKDKFQDILIIEKSKVLGGRLCTKPVGSGLADYGCQYFSPKTDKLASLVNMLKKKSIMKKIDMNSKKDVFISPYGMNKIPQYLSLGIPAITNSFTDRIIRRDDNWDVQVGSLFFKAKRVITTIPIKQVAVLLENSGLSTFKLPRSNYNEFFSVTFTSNKSDKVNIVENSKSLPWICNNKLKGVHNDKNVYTVNFSSELSANYQKLDTKNREESMRKVLRSNGFDKIENFSPHFWKYGFSLNQNNISHFYDEDIRLGICGDSFSIGQVDGAIISSDKVYHKILSNI